MPVPMPVPLAILIVVANSAFGGAERHVADLCNELARRGHRVGCVFTTVSQLRGPLGGRVEVFELSEARLAYRFVAHLVRSVRAFRPDVLHLHSPRATFWGRLGVATLVRRDHPALVVTAHGWIPRRLALRRLIEAVYLVTTPLDDATIAVSSDTARRFGRWARRVSVVPNGVGRAGRLPPYVGDPDRGPVRLGFVGRLMPEKGFEFALRAYGQALDRLPGRDISLEVYGDGPLLQRCRAQAERLAPGRVRFLGWVKPEEVSGVMSRLSAILLTSREEGLPYVLLEAMAAGCPVVASAVGGIPDLVRDGESGWLVRYGDVAAASGAIVRLATEPGLGARVRRAAWEKVGEASIPRMVEAVEQVYRAALARRGTARS